MEVCATEGGYCKENQCICYEGYITNKLLNKHLKCNYKQIGRMKAGLIEMIFGCGFGHFYSGRNSMGILKLSCLIIFCSCCIMSVVMIRKIREETEAQDHPYITFFILLTSLFKIILILWQLIDGMLFFLGFYYDGNNFPMF
jgi:hypothetical protein